MQPYKQGKTIILVTHEDEVAQVAQRKLVFRDGELISDTKNAPKYDTGGVLA